MQEPSQEDIDKINMIVASTQVNTITTLLFSINKRSLEMIANQKADQLQKTVVGGVLELRNNIEKALLDQKAGTGQFNFSFNEGENGQSK